MVLWKRKKKVKSIQEIFESNVKYISQTQLDVDVIKRQFVKTQSRYYLTVGSITCPTGHLIVADPLCYLAAGKMCPELAISIQPGTYPVEVAICRNDITGIRMCTARLKIKESEVTHYERALPTLETAVAHSQEGVMSGFPVDAGMISICDVETAKAYDHFLNEWYSKNPDKNHYDDYFDAFFLESAKALPAYQREGGDFIEWTIPQTTHRMVMIASGFGDGFYQSYWGYDKDHEICELVVPMVNPDLFVE